MNTGDSDAALDELKRLLLGSEVDQLARLSRRLDDLGIRAEELADVLPRALRLHQSKPNDLLDALETPVAECVQRSVNRDPGRFADALFPVMGPAIRRAISEALKGLVQSLNQALEYSLSAKGIAWRIEAMRTGAPFAEVVLRHTLAYRVEQAFLIQPQTGLLVGHVADSESISQDPDAVSGMLTAIESFVKDAFMSGGEGDLDTVDVGDHQVWLIRGPYALLACVIRGMPPVSLRRDLRQISEDIHLAYGQSLRNFQGDHHDLTGLEAELSRCLISEQKPAEKRRGGLSPMLLGVMAVLLAAAIWWGYVAWQDHVARERMAYAKTYVTTALRTQPGFIVVDARWQDGILHVHGLRDPSASMPEHLVSNSGLTASQVEFSWSSYYDLSPPFALARVRQIFSPPTTITMNVSEQGVLHLSGVAEPAWLDRVRTQATLVAGIQGVDDSGLLDVDSALLAEVRARLVVPETAELKVHEQILTITGKAPLAWLEALPAALAQTPGLKAIQLDKVESMESVEARTKLAALDAAEFHFSSGTQFDESQTEQLSATADTLRRLIDLAQQLGQQLQVRVIGRTDGVGSARTNTELARKRAQVFVDAMLANGVPDELFTIDTRLPNNRMTSSDPSLRRVDLQVSLVGPDSSGRQ